MIMYRDFLKHNIDLRPLGLEISGDGCEYFCTPKKAKVIGSLGVDGIHFCMVTGHGELVFAVSPMGDLPYVHAVAKSFDDFLGLMLALGDASFIEAAIYLPKDRFDAELAGYEPVCGALEAKEALHAIGAEAICEPWEYIRSVDADFDIKKLKFSDEYYELTEEQIRMHEPMKVSLSGGFSGRAKGEREGREVRVDSTVTLNGEAWLIPSVFLCTHGIVCDMIRHISSDKMALEHMKSGSGAPLFKTDFSTALTVNGKYKLKNRRTVFEYYDEFESSDMNFTAEGVLIHYGLPLEGGYIIMRSSHVFAPENKPKARELHFDFSPKPESHDEREFTANVGDIRKLTHPVTGDEYTLEITGLEDRISDLSSVGEMIMPECSKLIFYKISPDIPAAEFRLYDAGRGDQPKARAEKNGDFFSAIAIPRTHTEAVGIIGGADGPTVTLGGIASPAGARGDGERVAVSNLYFEAREITWRPRFRYTPGWHDEATIVLPKK